ncbi:hypothetical protein RHGRI_031126 [Rhododendron griersonianum]|uniref:Uncharacterized protein n=1 Tax=Rhododendron griersonianum TaxID=479676 RepID=A0AAV6I754_9ERIC|nr:hypothetical protein RHGRI_031126 [Rhododendron griersonianum]
MGGVAIEKRHWRRAWELFEGQRYAVQGRPVQRVVGCKIGARGCVCRVESSLGMVELSLGTAGGSRTRGQKGRCVAAS